MKVRISSGGNSGIQYRGISRPYLGLDVVTGYQCDVVPKVAKYNGMLYEEKGRRILSHAGEKVIVDPNGQSWIVGNLPVKEFASGEWHEYRVVEANHHRHWINIHPTADMDLDKKGRIGVSAMQVHGTMTVEFKEIKIKHLPDDLPMERIQGDCPIP